MTDRFPEGFLFKGLASLPDDSYFIRLSNDKNKFLHLLGDNPGNPTQEDVYRVMEGIGHKAAIFTKENALNLIDASGVANLEIAKVTEIIKGDGSLN